MVLTSARNVNVEVEAVLALVHEERQQLLQEEDSAARQLQERLCAVADVRWSLGAHRREGVCKSRVLPHGGRHRGHVAQRSDRRARVRDAEEGLDRLVVVLKNDAAERPVLGPYDASAVLLDEQLSLYDAEQEERRKHEDGEREDAIT